MTAGVLLERNAVNGISRPALAGERPPYLAHKNGGRTEKVSARTPADTLE